MTRIATIFKKSTALSLAITLFIISVGSSAWAKSDSMDLLYRHAQREFLKKNYKAALPLLQQYLSESKEKKFKRERLFWVIDQIGRIHLRVNKDPDAAIKFFENLIAKDKRLTEAEENDIGAWISAANDWKKNPVKPSSDVAESIKFLKGKEYFYKGKKKQRFPADEAGNAYFTLATTYLVPFINNNDHSPQIAEALLMMGEIRVVLRTDPEYWYENFYLKEVIRRFPHTTISLKAYALLEADVKFGYTGSSGDNTPPSVALMLKTYKKLSIPKKKVPSEKKG